mgnify:CR=1 FL=1
MSSGIILMQGAHTRILTRHARVLVHYPEHHLSGRHIDDLVRQIGDAKSYNEEMERLFLKRMQVKRPELTLEQLRQKLSYDWTMDAHEAVSDVVEAATTDVSEKDAIGCPEASFEYPDSVPLVAVTA